jgi:hypothetical protein
MKQEQDLAGIGSNVRKHFNGGIPFPECEEYLGVYHWT